MELDEETKKYIRTYHLVTHSDRRTKESFFHVTLMADFLLKCLKMANYFGAFEATDSNFSGDRADLNGAISYWQTRRARFQSRRQWPIHRWTASESFSLFGRARPFEKADRPIGEVNTAAFRTTDSFLFHSFVLTFYFCSFPVILFAFFFVAFYIGPFPLITDPLSEQERWIGSLLLRHIQLLQFNAHEVSELQMDRPGCMDGAKTLFLGAAIYPTVSTCYNKTVITLRSIIASELVFSTPLAHSI